MDKEKKESNIARRLEKLKKWQVQHLAHRLGLEVVTAAPKKDIINDIVINFEKKKIAKALIGGWWWYRTKVEKIIIIIGIIGSIASIVSFVAMKWGCPQKISYLEYFNNLLGDGNWCVFPDKTPNMIGVKRLPRDFEVMSPVKAVYIYRNDPNETIDYEKPKEYKFDKQGDKVYGDCAATLDLERAWEENDIPLWQREAYYSWKGAEDKWSESGKRVITPMEIDKMFGHENWKPHPKYSFAIIVTNLQKDLPVEYPITCVDAMDNLKYCVGETVLLSKGKKATVWFAGNIQLDHGRNLKETTEAINEADTNQMGKKFKKGE